MTNNLILSGGINHDFADAADALAGVLSTAGIHSDIFLDIDAGFDALQANTHNLVTLFCLRWRMLDDDKYIPDRDEWAYEISDPDRLALINHMAKGGGLLGLHTAAICFDTWSEYPELLGATWVWGTTFHPPVETFRVTPIEHDITKSIEHFEITDEIYHNIAPHTAAEPLLITSDGQGGSQQTLAWAHHYQQGRSVYSALAHDRQSIETQEHARFLTNAANWCVGDLG